MRHSSYIGLRDRSSGVAACNLSWNKRHSRPLDSGNFWACIDHQVIRRSAADEILQHTPGGGRPMKVGELPDRISDPRTLTERSEAGGCFLISNALASDVLTLIGEQATSLLDRRGVAYRSDVIQWTSAIMADLKETRLNGSPALDEFVRQIDWSSDHWLAERARSPHAHLCETCTSSSPYPIICCCDCTASGQLRSEPDRGDCRRLRIALTIAPFGAGSLGPAVGSHRQSRFPPRSFWIHRPRPANSCLATTSNRYRSRTVETVEAIDRPPAWSPATSSSSISVSRTP